LVGCENFVLVSSIGANANSNSFYLRLKGEVEEAIKEVGLMKLHIMRPSMLLGNRNEFRLGEKIGQTLMKATSFLIPRKYKAVHARDVAKAMVRVAGRQENGVFYYEYPFKPHPHLEQSPHS
jgi:uncharacterized protein YbjT (DUF2867 family)